MDEKEKELSTTATTTTATTIADDNDDAESECVIRPEDNLPVDEGWAWMVALAVFLLYAIYGGIYVTNSVLLLDILDFFHTSISTVTIQLTTNQICYGLASQVSANVLAQRFSVRKMASLAALVNVLGTLFLVSTPSVPVFIVAMCTKAIAQGMTLVPAVSLIGCYFKKKRAFAMAFCILGLSFSATVMPVLIDYLRNQYGFRGCILLYGAVELHGIPVAFLLRPVSAYRNKSKVKDKFTRQPQTDEADCIPDTNDLVSEDKAELEILLTNNKSDSLHTKSQLDDLNNLDLHKAKGSPQTYLTKEPPKRSKPEGEETVILTMSKSTSIQKTDSETNSKDSLTLDLTHVNSSLTSKDTVEGNIPEVPEPGSLLPKEGRDPVKSSNVNPLTAFFSSLVDLQLLQKPLAISALLSYNLFNELICLNTYFPSFGQEMGLTPSNAALLLSISGGMDVFSKLLLGFLADLKFLAPYKIILIGCICIGVVCQLNGLFNGFGPLLFFALCLGFFGGTGVSLNSVHIIDVLGVESLSKMLGLCILTFSVTAVLQNIVIGVLIERTGSFSVPVYLCGVNYLLASVILSLIPLTRRLQDSMKGKR